MYLYYSNQLPKDNVQKDSAENVEVPANLDVLLTVHLSIILAIKQLNAQNLLL